MSPRLEAAPPVGRHALSRRAIFKGSALLGGGLVLGALMPRVTKTWAQAAGTPPPIEPPSAFLRIDEDGLVTMIIPSTEMGQGIYTAEAALLAEELDVGLERVSLVAAPPDEKLYANALIGMQMTGGSTSIRAWFLPLRRTGAAARQMLIEAAAGSWGVPPGECITSNGSVSHAASGRMAGYGELAAAAMALPVPSAITLKATDQFRLIGKSLKRLDTPDKVRGKTVYGIDVRLPGMKIGTVASCPVFGGKLKSVDEAAALAVPGVSHVLKLDDAVAVVGDHMWAAIQGMQAAAPVWDGGAFKDMSMEVLVGSMAKAAQSDGLVAHDQNDAPGAYGKAATKLEATYQLPFLSHAPMEPINCTVQVKDGVCDVWVGTQVPTRARMLAAKGAGLAEDKVTIHNYLIGGGFGRRLEAEYVGQTAAFARQVDFPIKLVWSREQDIQHDTYRPYYYDQLRAGLDGQGRIVSWQHKVTGASVYNSYMGGWPADKVDPDAVEGAVETPYAFPAQRVDYVRWDPAPMPISWWRGVGPAHNVFVVESFMDELAHAAKQDPVAFRLPLLEKDPRAKAVLQLLADKSGWSSAAPAGVGRGLSLQLAFGSYVGLVIEASVGEGGLIRVHKATMAIDCGFVVNPDTVRAQMEGGLIFGLTAAMYGQITIEGGRVQQNNFNDYRMMRIDEAPVIDIHVVASEAEPGGIGETGTTAAFPALANAVFAATGKRLRKLPLSPVDLGAA
ncbi:isoquinoline 1-oxidoreductase, beta subunit [Arboricoccus pini]|uniref:Isoquinoline 1-oxidoreductase, beta subunit n=1 Tax=Arboricoccus pini TaxID=1963835 RepID=A0A212S314_9PROT|nr:xanthine dehydrogenase family protein molybdopterin-binding subunit [Arboricoccus pini]SNB79414.1 isoquinoline 1-oxidoreductase, beta subunit [Arboricoccus pini]